MISFLEMTYIFVVYAFLGWCSEVAFAAMKEGRFINRGFLNGPYCPIYGFGALLVILALTPLQNNLAALFFGSALITTVLEFVTGVVLEKLFHTRWWDYSDMPFNIKGHVCLMFTVLWGLACTFVMRILHPIIMSLFHIMPQPLSITLLSLFCAAMLADAVATACTVHKLSKKLKRITELAEELHKLSDELGENIYDTVAGLEHRATSTREWWELNVQPHLDELDETVDRSREALSDYMEQRRDDLEEARARYREGMAQLKEAMHRNIWESRLMSAFPKAHDNRYEQALERLKQNYARKRKKRDAEPEDRP